MQKNLKKSFFKKANHSDQTLTPAAEGGRKEATVSHDQEAAVSHDQEAAVSHDQEATVSRDQETTGSHDQEATVSCDQEQYVTSNGVEEKEIEEENCNISKLTSAEKLASFAFKATS